VFEPVIIIRSVIARSKEHRADSWAFSVFAPQQFFARGQTVVVLGEETGKDRSSGLRFENRWAHVFDVQGGQIVRFRE
jgi:ketosteroid isomerase-like protein